MGLCQTYDYLPAAFRLSDARPAPTRRVGWVAPATSLLVGLVGCVVLLGWLLHVEVMKSAVPGLVAMKANTALCLLLSAVAVWLVSEGRAWRRPARLVVAAAAAIAAVSLAEYMLGRSLGIDELLFHEARDAVGTSSPGRMAPNTAVAFLLISGAVFSLDVRSVLRGWLPAALALGAGLLALLALVGYVSGVTSLYAVSDVTQMAVPTAVAFILLMIGVGFSRPEAGPMRLCLSDTVGGRVVRRLLPVAIVLPIVLGVLRLAGDRAGLYTEDVGTWLFAVSIIAVLIVLTWTLAASLERAEIAASHTHAALQEVQRERAAFDEAPIGSALISPDGELWRVNRALCGTTGFTAEELIGRRLADITHRDDRASDAAAIEALISGRLSIHRAEKRFVRRDGSAVHTRVALMAIYGEDGTVAQLYAQIEDLTDARFAAVRLEQAQFETLARLAAASEYRDDDTGQHTRRVGDLAGGLAARLGLPDDIVTFIRLTAPLHDVGKIGIPDAILLKPGRLTEREVAHMQRHTTIGARMLADGACPQLAIAEQIAATHHERFDGTGYPAGLAGDDIPIAGRIVAVADVFDALTHARPYKEAWPLEKAYAELRAQRGRQFDPRVIDAFFELQVDGSLDVQEPDPRMSGAEPLTTNWLNPAA